VSRYGLSFGTKEENEFRISLFAMKDASINKINAMEENFTVGHNFMSTWTKFEYKRLLGYRGIDGEIEGNGKIVELPETNDVEFDWRTKGAVNPVRDQGPCGSCWAFSSIAAIEGAHFLASGKLEKFSESQLVDCDTKSSGCNGGLEIWAFAYAEKHELELESAYPYKAKTETCKAKSSAGKINVKSTKAVKDKDVNALKSAVAAGPTCVSVDAANNYFQGTPEVSSTPRNAVTTSIMPLPLLVTEVRTVLNISSSETPGLLPGEKRVTSECPSMSPEMVSVVFSWIPTPSKPIECQAKKPKSNLICFQ